MPGISSQKTGDGFLAKLASVMINAVITSTAILAVYCLCFMSLFFQWV